jgi:hypothetical protein
MVVLFAARDNLFEIADREQITFELEKRGILHWYHLGSVLTVDVSSCDFSAPTMLKALSIGQRCNLAAARGFGPRRSISRLLAKRLETGVCRRRPVKCYGFGTSGIRSQLNNNRVAEIGFRVPVCLERSAQDVCAFHHQLGRAQQSLDDVGDGHSARTAV